MDGSENQKRVVNELKLAIKYRQKQKRISRTSPRYTTPQGREIANTQQRPSPTLDPISFTAGTSRFQLDSYTIDNTNINPNPSKSRRRYGDPKEFETTLLMNYLDHVFPIQFNCYTPPVTSLGRGWLLALLTRTKPLYHAALSLSALHMYTVLLKMGDKIGSDIHWEEMRRHHSLAFQELQVHISGLKECRNVKPTIETLACVIQLICFEVRSFLCGLDTGHF